MRTSKQLIQERNLLEAEAITAAAQEEGRSLTAEEAEKIKTILDGAETAHLLSRAEEAAARRTHPGQPEPQPPEPSTEWRNRDGKPVHVLRPEQRLADLRPASERGSLGRLVRGMITGDWRDAELERRAMAEGVNTTGGFLVPETLSNTVIDKARNATVCMRLGAQTVAMDSDTLTLARVTTDPTYYIHGENATITSSDMAFDAISLHTKTIACLLYCSRELAEDSANFITMVENAISQSLAVKIDALVLEGSGSQEPLGLKANPACQAVTSYGSLASWDLILDQVKRLWDYNIEPTGYVTNPTIRKALLALKSGDGDPCPLEYMSKPAIVGTLQELTSNQVSSGYLYAGGFQHVLIGIRQQPLIEVSTTAGDTFAKHQVAVKATFRFDSNLTLANSVVVVSGIS